MDAFTRAWEISLAFYTKIVEVRVRESGHPLAAPSEFASLDWSDRVLHARSNGRDLLLSLSWTPIQPQAFAYFFLRLPFFQ